MEMEPVNQLKLKLLVLLIVRLEQEKQELVQVMVENVIVTEKYNVGLEKKK
ncbi:hypothetical protein CCP1ISM_2380001 [Azospirillaceae bacterium]